MGLLLRAQSLGANNVRTIYVAELHFPTNPDLDQLVRSKLIGSLAQDCGSTCTVLEENPDGGADAVLTGVVQVQTRDSVHYRGQAAMRLVNRDGAVLWAATVYSSPFAKSATSSLAENTAKKIVAFLTGK